MGQPFNPYAAPQAAPYAPTPGFGQPTDWEPGEVLKLAWERFGKAWVILVLGYLVQLTISQLVSQGPVFALRIAGGTVQTSGAPQIVAFASGIVSMVIGAFLQVGLLRVFLGAARGEPLAFGTLFTGADRFLPMVGLYFLSVLAMGLGLLLLIVPGFIVAYGISLAPFYVVDAGMGPVEAMRASWAATKGQKGKLFGFSIISVGIVFLGVIACCIGVIPATSLLYVAFAVIFTRLSGRGPAYPVNPAYPAYAVNPADPGPPPPQGWT